MSCCSKKTTSSQLKVVSNDDVHKTDTVNFFKANYFPYYNDTNPRGEEYLRMKKIVRMESNLANQLAEATYELHSMCLEVVDIVLKSDDLLRLFEIPQQLWQYSRKSWAERQTDLMARFDFLIDGGAPKLLEYNADTPTLLVEAAVPQSYLLGRYRVAHPYANDHNYVREALKMAWANQILKSPGAMHIGIACDLSDPLSEDYCHSNFVRLKAEEAVATLGLAPGQVQVHMVDMNDLVADLKQNKLKSLSKGIFFDILWKLYPYEWLAKEQLSTFLEHLGRLPSGASPTPTVLLEPPWKLIISSKALLPFLWQLYPGHPNLLPAYFENPYFSAGNPGAKYEVEGIKKWIIKQRFGREGVANYIAETDELRTNQLPVSRPNDSYFGSPIYQAFRDSVLVDGLYVSTSSWVIRGLPVGFVSRFSREPVTDSSARLMPFFIEGNVTGELRATEVQKGFRQVLYGDETGNLLVFEANKNNFTFRITNSVPNLRDLPKSPIGMQGITGGLASHQLFGNEEKHLGMSPQATSNDITLNHGQRSPQDVPLQYPGLNQGQPGYPVYQQPGVDQQNIAYQQGVGFGVQPVVGVQPTVVLQPTGYYGRQRWSTPYAQEEAFLCCWYRPAVPYYRRGYWGGYYWRFGVDGFRSRGNYGRTHHVHHTSHSSSWGGGHRYGGGHRFGGFGGGFG